MTEIKKTSAFPVFLAFLAMGFGDAVGPFVSLAKQQFALSNFTAQLVSFTGFLMFGILSVPMGVFQDRRGKKFVLLLGLSIMLAGILIPAIAGLSTFPIFLFTILLLGAGGAARAGRGRGTKGARAGGGAAAGERRPLSKRVRTVRRPHRAA